MFTQTKRLFGIAPPRTDPLVCDYALTAQQESGAPSQTQWQEDLDSLFVLVDAQMVERRGAAALPPAAPPAVPAPVDSAPQDLWIGFGATDQSATESEERVAVSDAGLTLEAALARVLEAGLPESFKDELRALVRAAVREAVAAALQAQPPTPAVSLPPAPPRAAVATEEPAPARVVHTPPLVSIRIRRSRASARSREYARPSSRAGSGTLGILSR